MNGRCDELAELLPLHALGALSSDEADRVARHLEAGCPRCAAELAGHAEAASLLAFALPEVKPSESAKARLMSRVRSESSTSAPVSAPGAPRATALWWRVAAAAAVTAVVSIYGTGSYLARKSGAEMDALRAQLASQSAELTDLKRQVFQAKDAIRMASAPGVRVVELAGQPALAAASARMFWDPKSNAWQLYAANLPQPAPGKTYQLWLVTATAKISAGTFTSDGTGQIFVPADAGTVVAAAVTDEPEGGSPQPTGSILLLGKI